MRHDHVEVAVSLKEVKVAKKKPNEKGKEKESDVAEENANDSVPRYFPLYVKGGVFCTLPLGNFSGLPVHISAPFELDSSRTTLVLSEENKKKRALNEALSKKIIACYWKAVAECFALLGPNPDDDLLSHFYTLWPRPARASDKYWREIAQTVMVELAKRQEFFVSSRPSKYPIFYGEGRSLYGHLQAMGLPALRGFPSDLMEMIKDHVGRYVCISPSDYRTALRQCNFGPEVPAQSALAILRFAISDEKDPMKQPQILRDLPLLRLKSGRYETFSIYKKPTTEEEIPRSMFREIAGALDDYVIDPNFYNLMNLLSVQEFIAPFNENHLAAFCELLYPAIIHHDMVDQDDPALKQSRNPSYDWLDKFWSMDLVIRGVNRFRGLCLFPVTDGERRLLVKTTRYTNVFPYSKGIEKIRYLLAKADFYFIPHTCDAMSK